MSAKIGASSELQCANKLVELGWDIAIPYTHTSAVDLLIYKFDQIRTIQVKGTEFTESGKFNRITVEGNKYSHIDFVILHDRTFRSWYIFSKGELDGKRTLVLDPNKLHRQHNNWKKIR